MPKINCEFCGKEIHRKPSYLKRFKHFYCDRKCQLKHVREKQPRVNCSACGKEIILKAGRRRNSRTGLYFCNNECKNPYIAKHKRWFQNPDCHRARRPIVLKAADYACQNCGFDEDIRMLDVHHYDGDHSNNDWSNLRSLCIWCHVGSHRQFVKLKKLNDLSLTIKGMIAKQEQRDETEKNKKIQSSKKYCLVCDIEIGKRTKTQTCSVCCGKNQRKAKRPTVEILRQQIEQLGYCGTGRKYGVSDNAIRKWLQ